MSTRAAKPPDSKAGDGRRKPSGGPDHQFWLAQPTLLVVTLAQAPIDPGFPGLKLAGLPALS